MVAPRFGRVAARAVSRDPVLKAVLRPLGRRPGRAPRATTRRKGDAFGVGGA